jgi:PAS domain S-box-containing protein
MANTHILIVEDEGLVAQSIINMIEHMGYAVAGVATSAQEAIKQTRDAQPDLVLMDIGLPGELDGVAAAQEIRTRFDTPVVYLTAYGDAATLERAKITQPLGYVLKPFHIRELQGAIEMALYRHEMEKKLKASEARYRTISELTSDFGYSVRIQADGTLVPEWETEAFKRSVGCTFEEIMEGGGWESLVHPDDLPIAEKHLVTHLSGQADVAEYRIITRSNETRWLRDYGQPVWDESEGRVVRLYGAAQDITEQVQAEEALRQKLEDQAALYEASQVFLDQLDVETTLQNMCQLFLNRFGLQNAWIGLISKDGDNIQTGSAWEYRDGCLKPIPFRYEDFSDQSITQMAIQTGQPVARDYLDSEPVYASQSSPALDLPYRSLAVLPLCYGEKVLGVINAWSAEQQYFTDDRVQVLQSFANLAAVALQKARYYEQIQSDAIELEGRVAERTAELETANEQLQREVAERKRTEAALRESEERFRTVADFTYDWEYWIDPDGNLLYVSPSCERMTGYGPDDFQRDPLLLEAIIHPDERDMFIRHLRHESKGNDVLATEFRIITRDGQERWIDHICQPVYNPGGRRLGRRASNRDTTDRKHSEEILRRYERIVSATPDLMAILSRDYVYQAVNDTYVKAFGKNRHEIIGLSVQELMGKDVFETLLKDHLERCLEGIATHYQAWLEFPRRGRRFMSVTYYPYVNQENAVSGIVVSSRDITELKRAEEALRRSETKYRAIYAASPDYVYVTDVEGRFVDANPAFLNWAGLSREEIQQRYFMHFFAGEHIRELQDYFEKVRQGHEVKRLGMSIKNTRGEVLECEVNAVPLMENGKVATILNVAHDVTDQVMAARELRESEEKYRALFEASTDAIFLETLDGRLLDCNGTACRMYGYGREELVGMTVADLMPEDTAATLPDIIAQQLKAGHGLVKARGKKKDGSIFPTEISTRLITLGDAQLIVTYVRDITNRVQREAKLQQALDQLKMASQDH